MTASGANAAGYTCEELIEYTSCNPGYYLNDGGDACPSGDTHYPNGVCIEQADMMVADFATKAECEAAWEGTSGTDYKWYTGPVCVSGVDTNYNVEISAANENAGKTCNECPIGSICSGGTESATPCPAGSYCAGTGLSAVSGQCSAGTFSFAGATACSTCPEHEYTNANGQTISVPATTVPEIGAGSVSACIIDSDKTFTDIKGTYHFKENCAYDAVLYPSCDLYLDMASWFNPGDLTCDDSEQTESDAEYICGDDADCRKNLIYNCQLYLSAYENEACEENENGDWVCTLDLGYGIKCEYF